MNTHWQPIETAPKDGTEVLLGGVSTPFANGVNPAWVDIGSFEERGYCGSCWYSSATDRDGDRLDCDPTHWMPLPEPPEVKP